MNAEDPDVASELARTSAALREGPATASLLVRRARAIQLSPDGDLAEAHALLERAVVLEPSNPEARIEFGVFLDVVLDRAGEAKAHLVRGLEIAEGLAREARDALGSLGSERRQ